ncbi:fluoride efflux transporter CrcB [Mycobacterium montefiorense]|uniref:fluoride efflux transporter CrcB n=1 Tax=Mycobacterium montefiorense TaxID=154654 RepID=UPI0021F299F4|nr:fluoride efflux transporter CrcB [Mycobacterium montefiorense]MCV7426130.1 fluoride efflux transporter CrcB [Mycobacterium montefiorense]
MISSLTILFGAMGAVTRFVVDALVKRAWPMRFPWATFLINVTGSLLLGILAGAILFQHQSANWQNIIGTGFCGGYTTFSTASFETVRLAEQGAVRASLINAFGSLITCVAACAAGLALAWLV